MNIGTNETLRAKLRMTIHRGGTGQRPNRLSATYAVAADEVILSGMIMTVVKNSTLGRNEWVKGVVTGFGDGGVDSLPNTFYIAVDDSTDGDNVCAGNLQGISCRGEYEISTSRFREADDDYETGDPLTYDAATGDFMLAFLPGQIVLAHVVKDYVSPVNLGSAYTPVQGDATVTDGVQGATFVRARETNAADLNRIRIELVTPYPLPAPSPP